MTSLLTLGPHSAMILFEVIQRGWPACGRAARYVNHQEIDR